MNRGLLFFFALLPLTAQSQGSNWDHFMARVICVVNDTPVTGSAFVIGKERRHFVTNRHVVEGCDNQGQLFLALDAKTLLPLRLLWQSPDPRLDLAILEAERPLDDKIAVTFVSPDLLNKGQDLFAIGFPGAADLDQNFRLDASVTKGIVSSLVTVEGIDYIQHSAPTNPGNSGGPILDECGRVIGINTLKSLVEVATVTNNGLQAERVALGEGIAWAISTKHLMPVLKKLNLSAEFVTVPCAGRGLVSQSHAPQSFHPLSWLTFLMAAVALTLVLRSGSRKRLVAGLTRTWSPAHAEPRAVPPPLATPQALQPAPPLPRPQPEPEKSADKYRLIITHGELAGAQIELGSEPIKIGSDPRQAKLVFSRSPKISGLHCVLAWDPTGKRWTLKDLSSRNGTFIRGKKIEPGVACPLDPDCEIWLASNETLLRLKKM